MDKQEKFGRWLRQRRHLLDYTQRELAARTGCSAVTIRKLEGGDRKPSASLASALAASLHIPQREWPAFIQFARSEGDNDYQLPGWRPEIATWRDGRLPRHVAHSSHSTAHLTLAYELGAAEEPLYHRIEDGRLLIRLQANGPVSGDIEGEMSVQLTQVILPKPPEIGYTQALPMSVGALFKIRSGGEALKGSYSGVMSPMLDAGGSGEARVQATGQILTVTAAFIDLFLHYAFIDDVVNMVEGIGTGARGTMQLKPAP